jgi:hypothetical protein
LGVAAVTATVIVVVTATTMRMIGNPFDRRTCQPFVHF